jgi:hypothetical protein
VTRTTLVMTAAVAVMAAVVPVLPIAATRYDARQSTAAGVAAPLAIALGEYRIDLSYRRQTSVTRAATMLTA